MALDIGIKSNSNDKYPLKEDLIVSLEDGEYSFLLKVFDEIKNKCGVEIDQYHDAMLQGGQLLLLYNLISNIIETVKTKPKEWDEFMGFQLKPKKWLLKQQCHHLVYLLQFDILWKSQPERPLLMCAQAHCWRLAELRI